MMLFKLAVKNIRKSLKDYAVYFITMVLAVAVFYMFNSLDSQNISVLLQDPESNLLQMISNIMVSVSVFVVIVFCFLIVYANRFMLKRRKQEFAVYLLLGMGKMRICTLLIFEMVIIGLCSLIIGLLIGFMFSQILSLIVISMFEADMSAYVFTFSPLAFFLTILSFSFIYALIMIFNTFSVSHTSPRVMFSARFQNDKIPYKNIWFCLFAFAAGVMLLVFAYDQVTNSSKIFSYPLYLIWMIFFGVVATVLIFWSISGLALRIMLSRPKIYFNGLTSFTVREIHSSINMTVSAMSIICILLFFTICIFSSAMSTNIFVTRQMQEAFPCDVMLSKVMELPTMETYDAEMIERSKLSIMQELTMHGFDQSFFSSTVDVNQYVVSDQEGNELKLEDTIDESVLKQIKDYYPTLNFDSLEIIMEVSDYNNLARLFHHEEIVLADNEYAMVADVDFWIDIRSRAMAAGSSFMINGKTLYPASDRCYEGTVAMNASRINGGIIIVPDNLMKREQLQYNCLFADYGSADSIGKQEQEDTLLSFLDSSQITWISSTPNSSVPDVYFVTSRISQREGVLTISLVLIFVGLYLGIVFLISSAVVLALKQLAQCSDSRYRYTILKKLGASESELCHSLFVQTSLFFGLPLALAVIHSVFGLKFCNILLSMLGVEGVLASVVPTALLILVIYGGYFLVTYLCCRSMIVDERN